MKNSKKYYFLFTFYFILFGAIVALLTSVVNYKINYSDIRKEIDARVNLESKRKIELVKTFSLSIENDLKYISNSRLLTDFVKNGNETNLKNVQDFFYAFSGANTNYLQLRYLDENGMEIIRVDRPKNSESPVLIKKESLQDKSDRYYFRHASKIKKNKIWYSKVDLNIENGIIEKPLNPVYRAAIPIYDNEMQKGIIIINIGVSDLLEKLVDSPDFNISIIDFQGEYIFDSASEKSWSLYLDNKTSYLEDFPKNAGVVLESKSLISSTLYSYSLDDYFNNEEDIKIIFQPKVSIIQQMQYKNLLSAVFLAVIVLAVSLPVGWTIAIVPARLQMKLSDAFDKITNYKEVVDRNVIVSGTDIKGTIVWVSDAFSKVTGYAKEEIIGKSHSILRHPDTPIATYHDLWGTIKNGVVWSGEMLDVTKEGNDIWLYTVITPEIDNKNIVTGYTAVSQNITDKKIIEKMSYTDHLTKLYNRHKMDEIIKEEIARNSRYSVPFSIVLLDIDKFKTVNDEYGHHGGDLVLRSISNVLKEHCRITDKSCRWGGEEFLIVLTDTELSSAAIFAEKIRAAIENTDIPVLNGNRVTISAGVTEYRAGESIENTISRADDGLYHAKNNGRNRVEIS